MCASLLVQCMHACTNVCFIGILFVHLASMCMCVCNYKELGRYQYVCTHLDFEVIRHSFPVYLHWPQHINLKKKYNVECVISSHTLTWQSCKWAHGCSFTSWQSLFSLVRIDTCTVPHLILTKSPWQSLSYNLLITFYWERICTSCPLRQLGSTSLLFLSVLCSDGFSAASVPPHPRYYAGWAQPNVAQSSLLVLIQHKPFLPLQCVTTALCRANEHISGSKRNYTLCHL